MKAEVKKNVMTYEGLRALEDELEDLKVNRRKEVAQKIKEAREQGDLSENAEYDAAKEEQREIEARIEEIDKLLKNAEVADADENAKADIITVGSTVKLFDEEFGEEVTYKIVLVDGEEESREALEEKVLKEAVNAIVVVGTKTNAPERETGANGKEIVSKVAVPDCDGSGHGYYVITYADGSVDYQDY